MMMPPVKVKESRGPHRVLWTLPQDPTTSNAHRPFVGMFEEVRPYHPDSTILGCDVVFFDGGTDVNPEIYNEARHPMTGAPDRERDKRESEAFVKAREAGASMIGVCRGAQFLCVMSGGKLVQHVTGHNGSGHLISTKDDIVLWSESSHHQVMWPGEINYTLIAWASGAAQQPFIVSDEYGKGFPDDRFPEILYCHDTKCLCIQGHTEWAKDTPFERLTKSLVKEYILGRK